MLHELQAMLSYRRPAFGPTERAFSRRFIEPTGAYRDAYGNWLLHVGSNPETLWSCHTDTVHRMEGMQKVRRDGDILSLAAKSRKTSRCLGADCAAGIWIMLEMIRAEVPGLYVFHSGEEIGGIGSRAIAKNERWLLDGIKYAIAFDRYGTQSIITHQSSRGCSNEFARDLAKLLGMGHQLDDTGVFTDTDNYSAIIPECTNISVGYTGHHTINEKQDLGYLERLRDAFVERYDPSQLQVYRDPSVIEFADYRTYYGQQAPWGNAKPANDDDLEELTQVVRDYPEAAARLLDSYGASMWDVLDEIEPPHAGLARYMS